MKKQDPYVYTLPREMAEPLVLWFREKKRDLPWRREVTPYRVWISEIMLQQTRVEAVKPYFERFLREIPDVRALAIVPEEKLLKLWEGLGYYSRARNLQRAAREIVLRHGGELPKSYAELVALTGVGEYTAGAIAAFAFGQAVPAVDGNVLRVIARVAAIEDTIDEPHVKRAIRTALSEIIPADAPSDFGQGLIELGATVCGPSGPPSCAECPIAPFCKANAAGAPSVYPHRKKKAGRRIEARTVLLLFDGRRCAIRRRPPRGLLAGLYEFPNFQGSLSEREVTEAVRAMGVEPLQITPLPSAVHIFTHIEWHMTGYAVKIADGDAPHADGLIFADREGIGDEYAIPSAFSKFKEQMP